MTNYSIDIDGSGTAEEIIKSLEEVITSIKHAEEDVFFTMATWEDPILLTEFSVQDEDETEGEYTEAPSRHIDNDIYSDR